MKTVIKWVTPIAVSLLLHAALITLVTYKLSIDKSDKNSGQTITVALIGQIPTNKSTPQIKKHNLAKAALPPQAPVEPESRVVTSSTPTELSMPVVTPAQKNDVQSSAYNQEPLQSEFAVQPLSKVTSPPAFLQKIEPVYPGSEQRAGSQANVLVEVTIDTKGKVVSMRVVKSAGINFDTAVIDALKKSVFAPAYIDKEPVAVRVLVPFRFNLK
jgi:periplasmic protein TonB